MPFEDDEELVIHGSAFEQCREATGNGIPALVAPGSGNADRSIPSEYPDRILENRMATESPGSDEHGQINAEELSVLV